MNTDLIIQHLECVRDTLTKHINEHQRAVLLAAALTSTQAALGFVLLYELDKDPAED